MLFSFPIECVTFPLKAAAQIPGKNCPSGLSQQVGLEERLGEPDCEVAHTVLDGELFLLKIFQRGEPICMEDLLHAAAAVFREEKSTAPFSEGGSTTGWSSLGTLSSAMI